jgi:hypothetical protein
LVENNNLDTNIIRSEENFSEVKEESTIALDELLNRVECNVLGLPGPVPS